jgi:FkbM family methyltransferase
MRLVVKTLPEQNQNQLQMWHRLRLLCPEPAKIALRRIRSRLIDPFNRGILIEVSGTQVRAPGYFKGGGRADYEMASTIRFKQWLKEHPEGLVVDVGCSVSTYGLIALSAYPGSRVIALDPDLPSLVWTRFICSMAERPSRLRLIRGFVVAAAEPPTNADAASADTAVELDRRSANPFAEVTKYQDGNDSANKTVPRHSIDALLENEECRGGLLIKIDVEGNELGVLSGAVRTFARTSPIVLASVHPQFGVDVAEVRRFFESVGYTCEHFATDHEEHWWCAPRAAPLN